RLARSASERGLGEGGRPRGLVDESVTEIGIGFIVTVSTLGFFVTVWTFSVTVAGVFIVTGRVLCVTGLGVFSVTLASVCLRVALACWRRCWRFSSAATSAKAGQG